MSNIKMYPILKYPGGKLREWPIISDNLPDNFNNYYEPFVGGGSTWLNISANHYYVNDLSTDLMNLYKFINIKDVNFIHVVRVIINSWKMPYAIQFIHDNPNLLLGTQRIIDKFINFNTDNLFKDIRSIIQNKNSIRNQIKKSINIKLNLLNRKKRKYGKITGINVNALTSIKSALYTLLRTTYNNTNNKATKVATYWFLREYAYSSMFRFNKHGDFNVPYGGASYNNKSLLTKLKGALSRPFQDKIHNTVLGNNDFYDFLMHHQPKSNDFVFLDPPYDTVFSTYDGNKFGKTKQLELSRYLKNDLHAYFMLIIKASPLINHLYHDGEDVVGGKKKLRILKFDKRYQVSFQNRNNKETKHLLIMNY